MKNKGLVKLRSKTLNLVEKPLKLITKVQIPETKMPDSAFSEISNIIKSGDILLSHREWAATNLLIKDFWKHAAICHNGRVIESVMDGVRSVSLAKWLYVHDYVIILRPTFCDSQVAFIASYNAFQKIGLPYDYKFNDSIDAFYCSELVYYSYDVAMGHDCPFTLRETMGVSTVTPQDFVNAKDKFEIIWTNK